MKAINLNIRGRIEYPVETLDATYRNPQTAWALLGVRYMQLVDDLPSRSENETARLSVAQNYIRCRMRFCTDVDSTMRIVVNRPTATAYNIVSGPAIIGNNDYVEFMLERVQ